jgi:hypothetical protein
MNKDQGLAAPVELVVEPDAVDLDRAGGVAVADLDMSTSDLGLG